MLITESPEGVPCWFELSSTDPQSSFNFYSQLFGWNRTDMDLGAMGTYSFLSNANGTIGAFCDMQPDLKAHGAPSYWAVYFSVDQCDASTSRAVELGASVVMQPMDVSSHGRLSILTDPEGAMFCLWQTRAQSGDFVMFEDHSVGWVELATKDTAAARKFYGSLLGWTFEESEIPVPDSGNYVEISIGNTKYGGMIPMNAQWGDIPAHWGLYIMVPDVDACVAKAKSLGGEICLQPFDAPGVGRIGMVTDPTGANTYVIHLDS